MPGWYRGYGYHGDNGQLYTGIGNGVAFGPTFTKGDIIGCGIRNSELFFTKNGTYFATRIYVDGK